MRSLYRLRTFVLAVMAAMVLSLVTVDFAEARRGGSFGSRGARTFDAPAATRTAPNTAAPVQRTTTQQQPGTPAAGARAGAVQPNRGGLFGGLAGGLLGGLMLGGLVGLLMGGGLGGLAGFFGLLIQVALIAGVVWLVLRLVRGSRSAQPQPAYAGMGGRPQANPYQAPGSTGLGGGSGARPTPVDAPRANAAAAMGGDEVGLTGADFDAFERLLGTIQAAFVREDYATIRANATPEIVSFLSEELSQNATQGRKNDVRDVHLLQGDLSEAWREGNDEYATVAMRYSSVDVMRDRETGAILEGDETTPTETTELWTFVRPRNGQWKLSAIQEA